MPLNQIDIPANPDLDPTQKSQWEAARRKIRFFNKNSRQPLKVVETTAGKPGMQGDLRRVATEIPVREPKPTSA